MTKIQFDITEHFTPLFEKEHEFYNADFLTFYGGRGGMKSWQTARALLLDSLSGKKIYLCTREFQNSISDSVLEVLEQQAEVLGIHEMFDFQRNVIYSCTGSKFIFKGLARNVSAKKSIEGCDVCWIEEAETISQHSLDILIPTIRKAGSKMILTFNTGEETDPVYKRFILEKEPEEYLSKITYLENPWISDKFLRQAEKDRKKDYDKYAHIYLGEPWHKTDAQIFKNWVTEDFVIDPAWGDPLFGADWGFARDPSTLIKMYYYKNVLYIDEEVWEVGCEIRHTAELFDKVLDSRRFKIRADSARPEVISHMKHEGFNIEGVSKCKLGADKKGYVEGGVSWLQGLDKIVIRPRCKRMLEEARLYSYKTDKLTLVVKNEILDDYNHCWDAIRYGVQPLIQNKGSGGVVFI